MRITLHNTLSNSREEFAPANPERVTMYVCGPTVHGPSHLGNARPAAVFDVLFRLLSRAYPNVAYARNITDIDDKIIAAAEKSGEETAAVAARWRGEYERDMRRLFVLPPTFAPAATECIGAMIKMISLLIKKENAYESGGNVLFSAASFPAYGALSNRRDGDAPAVARVEAGEYKRDPADFVLWKPSPPEAPGWESPWGRGRPGWHIECSAMAAQCLGETIDIHGGGQDLIFPHHENEIAQSCCASGKAVFAKYWMHNGHLALAGEKMSKSLGNTLTISGALAKHPGEAVRYALLATHYRHPLNWSESLLSEAKRALDSLYRAAAAVTPLSAKEDAPPSDALADALADDINTPAAFAALHSAAGDIQRGKAGEEEKRAFLSGANLMGFLSQNPDEWFKGGDAAADNSEIEELIERRRRARENRDFSAADDIRKQLAARGIVLEDSPEGTKWRSAS